MVGLLGWRRGPQSRGLESTQVPCGGHWLMWAPSPWSSGPKWVKRWANCTLKRWQVRQSMGAEQVEHPGEDSPCLGDLELF